MLGEDHSLVSDFPKLKDKIHSLNESDHDFKKDNERYTELDKKIRSLELSNSPIGDEDMQQLKHERSTLKDALYQRLTQ